MPDADFGKAWLDETAARAERTAMDFEYARVNAACQLLRGKAPDLETMRDSEDSLTVRRETIFLFMTRTGYRSFSGLGKCRRQRQLPMDTSHDDLGEHLPLTALCRRGSEIAPTPRPTPRSSGTSSTSSRPGASSRSLATWSSYASSCASTRRKSAWPTARRRT